MAARMKWWVAVLAGCTIATLWAHASVRDLRDFEPLQQAHWREEAAARTLRVADIAYRELVRSDSLLPMLPAQPGITTMLAPGLPAELRDTVLAVLQDQLNVIGTPRVRLGVFMIDTRFGHRNGAPHLGNQHEVYAGSDSLGPYCASVDVYMQTVPGSHIRGVFGMGVGSSRYRTPDVLRQCTLHARYGAPGEDIARWLENGAHRFAVQQHVVPYRMAGASERSSNPFQRLLTGCAAGRMDLCESIIDLEYPMRERVVRHPLSRASYSSVTGFLVFDGALADMIYEIEREFGAERFGQFWTSDADVRTAFAAAFGTSFGVWVREWGQARFGGHTPGPHVASGGVIGALLAISLLFAAALRVAHHRRIA